MYYYTLDGINKTRLEQSTLNHMQEDKDVNSIW